MQQFRPAPKSSSRWDVSRMIPGWQFHVTWAHATLVMSSPPIRRFQWNAQFYIRFFPFVGLRFWHCQINASQFVSSMVRFDPSTTIFSVSFLTFFQFSIWSLPIIIALTIYRNLRYSHLLFSYFCLITASCCVLILISFKDLQRFPLSLLHFSGEIHAYNYIYIFCTLLTSAFNRLLV